MNLTQKQFEELLAAAIATGMMRGAVSKAASSSEASIQREAFETARNVLAIGTAARMVKPQLSELDAIKNGLGSVGKQKGDPFRLPVVNEDLAGSAEAKAAELRKENPKLMEHQAFAEALRQIRQERAQGG